MPDKAVIEKLLSNTPFALILSGAFLVLVAASGGFPLLSIQVDELGWRIALAILGVLFVFIGLLVWWREKGMVNVSKGASASKEPGELLEKIGFDYSDSPTNHGWRILECPDETQVVLRHFDDGFVGSAIEIRSTVWYAMDYAVKPVAVFGSIVEFVAILENKASIIYAGFSLRSSDDSKSKPGPFWLNFPVGKGQPIPHGDGNTEWSFPVEPTLLHPGSSWVRFQVDLNEAVNQTFGTLGWRFGQLIGFRLRGNLSLTQISIFKAEE